MAPSKMPYQLREPWRKKGWGWLWCWWYRWVLGVDGLGVAPSLGSLGLGGLVVVVGGGWVVRGDRAIGQDGFQCDSCVTDHFVDQEDYRA